MIVTAVVIHPFIHQLHQLLVTLIHLLDFVNQLRLVVTRQIRNKLVHGPLIAEYNFLTQLETVNHREKRLQISVFVQNLLKFLNDLFVFAFLQIFERSFDFDEFFLVVLNNLSHTLTHQLGIVNQWLETQNNRLNLPFNVCN